MPIDEIVPRLVEAGLNGDKRAIESLALRAIRTLRPRQSQLAKAIADVLAASGPNRSPVRGVIAPPAQHDISENANAIAVKTVDSDLEPPILRPSDQILVERVLIERRAASELAMEGLSPIRSVILEGPPGVGKTYLAHYFAAQLNLPLIVLDLATAVSSLLGQTGQNIKSAFNVSISMPSLLLLDEFDAIGQERGMGRDVGELRRIVSVLLNEVESWPSTSLLVAATNHPDLIDGAMWRRFDLRISLVLPDSSLRERIWIRSLSSLKQTLPNDMFKVLAVITEDWSAADIVSVGQSIKKRIALGETDPIKTSFNEVLNNGIHNFHNEIGEIVRLIWSELGGSVTQAQLGNWLGIGQPTVSYHLRRRSRGK